MASLTIKVGISPSSLKIINPNDEEHPLRITSPHFEGHILVRINHFRGQVPDSKSRRIETLPYFQGRKRVFSIQVQGRFQKEYSLEDLVWASDWDKPLKVSSLMGMFSKFWSMTDPGSRMDLKGDKPSVSSYMITSACAVEILQMDDAKHQVNDLKEVKKKKDAWCPKDPGQFQKTITEDIDALLPEDMVLVLEDTSFFGNMSEEAQKVAARRRLFSEEDARKELVLGPQHIIAFENFNPYFDPNTFKIKIPGVSLNMKKILNGQPFRMSLRTKDKSVTFFVIEMSLGDDESGGDDADSPEMESLPSPGKEGSSFSLTGKWF